MRTPSNRCTRNRFKLFPVSGIYISVRPIVTFLGAAFLSIVSSAAAPRTRKPLCCSRPKPCAPGDTVMAGILLRMEPRWHTYCRNPGESGRADED